MRPPAMQGACWDIAETGLLLDELAKDVGLSAKSCGASRAPEMSEREFSQWLSTAGSRIGVEVEREDARVGTLLETLRMAAPALIRTPDGMLGLIELRGGRATLIGRDLQRVRVRESELEAALRNPVEAPLRAEVEAMLAECGIDGRKRDAAARAILTERLREQSAASMWPLRTPPGAGIWRQLQETGLVRRMAMVAGIHGVEYALWLAAWWVMGTTALAGRADRGWMMAWILLTATMIPLHILSSWTQGLLAAGCGGLLRQRLLAGALRLEPGEIKKEGVGQLLGRTLEAETVESLATTGGIGSGLALLEAVFALAVLWQGPGGAAGAGFFLGAVALAGWWTRSTYQRQRAWTGDRLAMTHQLVERMSGHRTRLAQQLEANWHDGEDQAMEHYLGASAAMDREWVRLTSLTPRLWLLAGTGSLAPAFLSAAATPGELAVGIGGILLGYRALQRLTLGAGQLAGAWIAWEKVRDLFAAAARDETPGEMVRPAEEEIVVEARGVSFQHEGRTRAVLEGASLEVRRGDWILLEGTSGGGKSTFGALLAGLREPTAGLVLAGGLDRRTLGDSGWRRIVALAPQYHENHVLTGTFAFNLLMGRVWPPAQADVDEAGKICQELGLGPLLERMPGGMAQMVGETGWQLSQGERSRLFLARALLQDSRVVILDESLAALDPENLRQALECAQRRAKTLIMVAHP